MDKYRKNLTSFIVFGINLILMGVGFLFIKNSDQAKKQGQDSDFSGSVVEDISTGKDAVVESIPALEPTINKTPVAEKSLPALSQNITSQTAPTQPSIPSSKPKSSAKTKTS